MTTPNLANLPVLLSHVAREMARGFADAEDTVYCPRCGERRKSAVQAVQAERDETCMYVCTACGVACDECPF